MRQSWEHVKGSKPGHRFQSRYYCRRQHSGQGGLGLGAILYVLSGIAVMLAGLFFVPAPGPGWLIFFLGLGLLAGEFLYVARFLDWSEVKSRGAVQWARGVWVSSSTAARTLICVVAITCAATLAYGAYYLLFHS
jgi:uncharacterized protein (TIGR02611 family)